MKTNVILKSEDRSLFGIKIRQQTKTGFLNLSDLQDSYDAERFKKGWSKKDVTKLFIADRQKINAERIFYILKEQGLIKVQFYTFIKMVKEQGLIKVLKKLKAYKTTGARQTKTTWADPYIWMLAALEMHPEIYAKTVIWLTDKLILNRIEAGNFYKELTNAISKFEDVDYIKMAKGLNYIVFGRHQKGMRNFATETELREIHNLESQFAFAINQGYIKTFDEFINELRKIYHSKEQAIK